MHAILIYLPAYLLTMYKYIRVQCQKQRLQDRVQQTSWKTALLLVCSTLMT